MDSEKSVLVMMTTYNGERFLKEQLDSILLQTYRNFKLVIQDDGSTDGTWEILREYAGKDDRIALRKNEGLHGAYFNFHSLINAMKREEPFDYYMFSDQDDVFMPEKMSFYVKMAEDLDPEVPALFYSDMWIIDGEGKKTGKSLDDLLGITYRNRWSLFFQMNAFGCSSFLNRKLMMLIPDLDVTDPLTGKIAHDAYFAKFAAMLGKLRYFPQKTTCYRRYGGNVTSRQTYRIGIEKIASRLLGFEQLARDHAPTYTQSLLAIKKLEPFLTENDLKNVTKIRKAIEKGGVYGLYIYLKYKIGVGKKARTFSRGLVLLTGRYKKYLDGRAPL